MLLKKSLIGVALACTALSSHAFFSSTTDLGTLSPTPTGAFTFAGVGVLGINLLGNSFVFDLSAGSDVYLDVYTLAGVTLGGAFELSTASGQEISSQLLASGTNLGLINADVLGYAGVGLLSHRRITFDDVAAGNNYKVTFDPGLASVSVFNKVKFSAAAPVPAIPEPGTWALMGLGLCGIAAVSMKRRRAA